MRTVLNRVFVVTSKSVGRVRLESLPLYGMVLKIQVPNGLLHEAPQLNSCRTKLSSTNQQRNRLDNRSCSVRWWALDCGEISGRLCLKGEMNSANSPSRADHLQCVINGVNGVKPEWRLDKEHGF